jgi:hypothetical protein
MAVIQRPIRPIIDTGRVLRVGGAFTAIFSLAMGLLILFVVPIACSFVGGIQLIVLSFLFIGGLLALLLGKTLWR